MANYFAQFSCLLDVGESDHLAQAIAIRDRVAAELEVSEDADLGFDLARDPDSGPAMLWISSDGHGEPDHVVRFVLACAEAFDLRGRWGFTWALTCSRPRLDAFGGGAEVLDLGARRSVTSIDCHHWLAKHLDPRGIGNADRSASNPAAS